MMKNRKYKIQKDIAFLTISMFITVAIWIASNVYDAYVTSTIDEVLQTQIIPIDGKFNLNAVQQLKNRVNVPPDYSEASASAQSTVTPIELQPTESQTTETLSPSPIPSGSDQQEAEILEPTL